MLQILQCFITLYDIPRFSKLSCLINDFLVIPFDPKLLSRYGNGIAV